MTLNEQAKQYANKLEKITTVCPRDVINPGLYFGFLAGADAASERVRKLETALIIATSFIDKYAGPNGSGCELGSMQHLAQQTREAIKECAGDTYFL